MNLIRSVCYLLVLLSLGACNAVQTSEVKGIRIAVDNSIESDPEIEEFIAPFKKHLNSTLDSTLAFNPKDMLKNDGDLNTAVGNLMADIVMTQANPVFEGRTKEEIDMVLLNHGGIRSSLDKGNISARSAYALMPFENEIVVAQLTGAKVHQMLSYLETAKTPHPVSGIKIEMNRDYKVTKAEINGKQIEPTQTYFVATSDYLQQGGDHMTFFKDPVKLYKTDYKLRNAIIDYFKKTDTLTSEKDDRFIRTQM